MAGEPASVGVCPLCESAVSPGRILIEYEKGGERAAYAECPSCDEVISPR